MSELNDSIRKIARELRRYLEVARLVPSWHWLLPLSPMIGALLLASGGVPRAGAAIGLLVAVSCLWGVAWTFNDLMNARRQDYANSLIMRGVLTVTQSVRLMIIFILMLPIVSLLLGWRFGTLVPLAMAVAFTYPWVRKRTYLIEAWAGLGIAWTVPMAYAAVGHWPDKLGALLTVVTLLWATGWLMLRQWPRHDGLMARGIRSLGMMFGPSTGHVVSALQITVVAGAWMAAGQEKHGHVYTVALVLCVLLMAWQSLLLHRKEVAAVDLALKLHVLAGASLWLGIALQAAMG